MSLIITPNSHNALTVKQQLAMLALPANKRIKLLKQLGRSQRAKARQRIREQKTVYGQKFAQRSDGKKANY